MKILVTGGAGFVGSNLAKKLKQNYPNYEIVVFDNLRRRGSELNLKSFKEREILFVHGDVRSPEDLESISDIDLIIDASAEPSVLAGLSAGGASQLVNINFMGTLNILNLALKNSARLIFLSTSRVYSIAALNAINYEENESRYYISSQQELLGVNDNGVSECFDVLGPRSLYGTTKLASEMLIQEFCAFMGLKAIINRCGVIAGPGQLGKVDQGVLVLWVARHYWKKPLSYIGYEGSGKQLRDLLHIDDLFDLLVTQIDQFERLSGMTFNVGGGQVSNASLLELTQTCQEVVGNKIQIDKQPETRVADVRIYVSDNSKIENEVPWQVKQKPIDIVADVFKWLRANETDLAPILK